MHYLADDILGTGRAAVSEQGHRLGREVIVGRVSSYSLVVAGGVEHKGSYLVDFEAVEGYLFLVCLQRKSQTQLT